MNNWFSLSPEALASQNDFQQMWFINFKIEIFTVSAQLKVLGVNNTLRVETVWGAQSLRHKLKEGTIPRLHLFISVTST